MRQHPQARLARRSQQRQAARAAGLRPAPGDLATLQDFVNTAPRARTADRLASPGELGRWLEKRRLLDAGTALDEDQWRRALDLRRGLQALIFANRGAEADTGALLPLERAAAGGRLTVRFDDHGPVGVGPASASFDDALATLVAIVATARIEGHWPLLKLCVRDACRRAFFDASVSRKGKWCTPQCGERERAATRRRRRRK